MNYLELQNITASYGETNVLNNFSIQIERGELVALLGASGCGKTTVLKIIAGLLNPDSGKIWLDGTDVSSILAEKRQISMVFQKPLLFPFLNVADNVAFGLKMRKIPQTVINNRVAEVLKLVKLENFDNRKPKQLSGGQEQRVALARALVTQPRVLLLDEPFSALDAGLRIEMRNLVNQIQRKLEITTVFVTHDQKEAIALADKIAFLDSGNLKQLARPQDFFTNPETTQTARFFGWKVVEVTANDEFITTKIGRFHKNIFDFNDESRKVTHLAFRPDQIEMSNEHQNFKDVQKFDLSGTVERIVNLGGKYLCFVKLSDGEIIETETAFAENLHKQQTVRLLIPLAKIKVFYE
ncbi:MAG: ABC transporter ATP-binding protein [Pyrinomonadaceae bacterium]|nr:ABC transporter ATP-binding protein [Pyrinomonadaceae bacterium]